jgi:uncharacterized membrane protein YbaN (DUF454 family)
MNPHIEDSTLASQPQRPAQPDAGNAEQQTHLAAPHRSRWVRAAWAAAGLSCVAIGAIGVVLPGLPTTPFLVLAAACFFRSSQALYDRVLANRTFGPTVRAFREQGTLPPAIKWPALGTMVVFVGFAVGWAIPAELLWVRGIVLAAGIVGAVYLLRLPAARV